MKILVACEQSGTVRDSFRRRGHDAWSNDLEGVEPEGEFRNYHLFGDALWFLDRGWDMLIAFPPCTYLASSGLHWNNRTPGRSEQTELALVFVNDLLNAKIPKIALENPVGCINTKIRKPNQVIQPWMFGEDASKATCLWLKGLPKLVPTKIIPPKGWQEVVFAMTLPDCECCDDKWCPFHEAHYFECDCIGPTQDGATYKTINGVDFATLLEPAPHPVWANQTPSGQNKLGPSPERAKIRAKTYQGIADAMAQQWGELS